jgi:ketosteroid isomerase-like protein
MSQENVEVIQSYYDRWDARDLAPAFELLVPDIEWHTAPSSLSAGKTLHGVAAVRPTHGRAALSGSRR